MPRFSVPPPKNIYMRVPAENPSAFVSSLYPSRCNPRKRFRASCFSLLPEWFPTIIRSITCYTGDFLVYMRVRRSIKDERQIKISVYMSLYFPFFNFASFRAADASVLIPPRRNTREKYNWREEKAKRIYLTRDIPSAFNSFLYFTFLATLCASLLCPTQQIK